MYVVCCMLYVVCCMLYVVCCTVRCTSSVLIYSVQPVLQYHTVCRTTLLLTTPVVQCTTVSLLVAALFYIIRLSAIDVVGILNTVQYTVHCT
jgi:hypothetical protein